MAGPESGDRARFRAYVVRFRDLVHHEMTVRRATWTGDARLDLPAAARVHPRLIGAALRAASRDVFGEALPLDRLGDRVHAFAVFVECFRRLPTSRLIYSDVLYALKATGRLLDPLRVFVSDKELVKDYVARTVGAEHNVQTLAVLRSRDELEAYRFPDRCFVKPTHLSGQRILRLGGEEIDRSMIAGWFDMNQYPKSRQANYRDLAPKVIVEPIIFDDPDVWDYKFICWNGVPRLNYVISTRRTDKRGTLYDTEWQPLPYSIENRPSDEPIPRPANLDRMREVAAALSRPFDFMRVDLYTDGRRVLVGELTNCPTNGAARFRPTHGEWAASQALFGPDAGRRYSAWDEAEMGAEAVLDVDRVARGQ